MTQNVDRETVVSRLLGTDDILILCHKNPDGDTIGSGAALCKALQHLGKTAAVLCSDPIPAMYDYMQITVYDGSFTPAFVVAAMAFALVRTSLPDISRSTLPMLAP